MDGIIILEDDEPPILPVGTRLADLSIALEKDEDADMMRWVILLYFLLILAVLSAGYGSWSNSK